MCCCYLNINLAKVYDKNCFSKTPYLVIEYDEIIIQYPVSERCIWSKLLPKTQQIYSLDEINTPP
jgi:hypothetical protein